MSITPGPWRAGYLDEEDRKLRMIVRAEAIGGQPYVAICPNPIYGEHEANARLIAAAPELLSALQQWVDLFGPIEKPGTEGAALLALSRQALNKAEGNE